MNARILPLRFWRKVRFGDGCWEWVAGRDRNGYGRFKHNGRMRGAHSLVAEALLGPIPVGYEPDHTCRNRACVRPGHLEIVTQRVNALRGVGVGALNARKTHCGHGHPFDAENTHVLPDGERVCRECDRRRHRQMRQGPS